MSTVDALNASLEAVTRRIFPGAQGVAGLRRLTGGASQETWAFEAITADGALPLILRRAPGGDRQHETAIGLEAEAELIRLAGAAGVPEPEVRYVLTPADGIGRGFIVDFISGETIGRKIVREAALAEARKTLAWRCGQVMATIHAIPLDRLPPLRRTTAAGRVEEIYARYKAGGRPRPVFSMALEWLRANLPPQPAKPVLVHGDLRNGNIIVGPDGLRAVLDWEIAHIGDPIEDLGWICVGPWRFGAIDEPVGGFGSREELMAGYAAGGGGAVDAEHIKFWEVLGSTWWGVACAAMTQSFRDGSDPTADRAMIGRRASESEIDLMNLLAARR
jgi:aminoglycoside phosphotransferase (APT) family kinase protein